MSRRSSGKYATEYDYHGSKLSEGVKEVVWSGGKLPTTITTNSSSRPS